MPRESLLHHGQPLGIDPAHARDVPGQHAAAREFGQRGLRQLIRVQIAGLLHRAQTFNHARGRHNPADAQSRKRHLREAIDLNHQICAVELPERRQRSFVAVQPGVYMIFDHRRLMARGDFEQLAARFKRQRGAGRIMKIWREDNQLHTIGRKRGFERAHVQSRRFIFAETAAHRDA